MPKYEVTVGSDAIREATIEVEARDEEEAVKAALAIARGLPEDSDEWEWTPTGDLIADEGDVVEVDYGVENARRK